MCSASGLFAVMISTAAPSCTVAVRSTSSPSIFPASAAFARPAPMEAATSATVAPASSVFFDPSGKTISMIRSFLGAGQVQNACAACVLRLPYSTPRQRPSSYRNRVVLERITPRAHRSTTQQRAEALGTIRHAGPTLSARGFKWRRRCMASVLRKRALSHPEWDMGTVPLSH